MHALAHFHFGLPETLFNGDAVWGSVRSLWRALAPPAARLDCNKIQTAPPNRGAEEQHGNPANLKNKLLFRADSATTGCGVAHGDASAAPSVYGSDITANSRNDRQRKRGLQGALELKLCRYEGGAW